MSINKKIHYGDRLKTGINEDITLPKPTEPTEGRFTFDRIDITFDTMMRTFDEN